METVAYTDPRRFANASVFHRASIRRGIIDGSYKLYFHDRKGRLHFLERWAFIAYERK